VQGQVKRCHIGRDDLAARTTNGRTNSRQHLGKSAASWSGLAGRNVHESDGVLRMSKFGQVPKSYWAAIYRKWQIRVSSTKGNLLRGIRQLLRDIRPIVTRHKAVCYAT
jgi:hypothetical protein